MPSLGAILRRERTLVDGEHRLLKPRPAPLDPLMRPSVVTPGAQRRPTMRSELRAAQECRPWLVYGLVDALVTQPHPRLVGEPSAQVPADLLRAPPLEQQLADQLAQLEVGLDPPLMTSGATRRRPPMGLERTVTSAAGCVAAQFARDRRGCPPELVRDLPNRHACVAQVRDLYPLVLRQEPRTDLTHCQPFQRRHEPDYLTAAVDLVTTGPIAARRAAHPDLAGCCPHAPPPLPQLHEPLTLGRQRTPPRPLLHTTRRRQHDPR